MDSQSWYSTLNRGTPMERFTPSPLSLACEIVSIVSEWRFWMQIHLRDWNSWVYIALHCLHWNSFQFCEWFNLFLFRNIIFFLRNFSHIRWQIIDPWHIVAHQPFVDISFVSYRYYKHLHCLKKEREKEYTFILQVTGGSHCIDLVFMTYLEHQSIFALK